MSFFWFFSISLPGMINQHKNPILVHCDTLVFQDPKLFFKKHIFFLSFVANCIAIPILGSKEMSSMFNRLLTCLAIFDNIFIVCSVFDTIRKHWIQNQAFEYIFGYFLYQFHNMIVCCCTYITVVLALERYHSYIT